MKIKVIILLIVLNLNIMSVFGLEWINFDCPSVIVMDLKSGTVLYEKNADAKMYPASTTKVMTALLALEKEDKPLYVTASRTAIEPIKLSESNIGIRVGETLTYTDLLYALLVPSGNDAANVLAEAVSGDMQSFINLMNERAAELGASNTHFVNTSGVHNDEHYTTACDLAKISMEAMKNEEFRKIVATPMYTIQPTEKYTEVRYLANTNQLISTNKVRKYRYEPAIGVKTGFTSEAGNCLISAAKSGDIEVLTVVLGGRATGEVTESFNDSRESFKFVFSNYKYEKVIGEGEYVSEVKVKGAIGKPHVMLVPMDNKFFLIEKEYNTKDVIKNVTLNREELKAPIKAGEQVGVCRIEYKGSVIGEVPLTVNKDVKLDPLYLIFSVICKWYILTPVIIFFMLWLISLNRKRVQRRKRRAKQRREFKKYRD